MTEKLPLDRLSRRQALTGAAGVGVVLPVLAACAGNEAGPVTADDPSAGTATGGSPSAAGGDERGGTDLAATSDIEVGGGAIFPDEQVVVTQPSEGDFRAFSTVCTHQGCAVAEVSGDGIVCPCHGSVFSITDGAPQGGPATVPLEERAVTVEGGRIGLV